MSNIITLSIVVIADRDTEVMVTSEFGGAKAFSRICNSYSNTNDDIASAIEAAAKEVIVELMPNN